MRTLTRLAPLTLALPLALAGCGGGGSDSAATASAPAPQDVTIQFTAVAGAANTAVACGTPLAGVGSVATDAQLTDLRFYLSDVQLVNDQGVAVPVMLQANEWQLSSGADRVVLIDLENAQGACAAEGTAATNAVVKGQVPAGTYVALKASLGVPDKLSHSDVMAAAAPLDLMAMGWSWQAGRKFAKIELNPVGGVTTPSGAGTSTVGTYNLHLASTDCTGNNDGNDTCAKKNVAQIRLPFNAATQQVAIDVAEVFRGSDIRTNQDGAVGCMSATSDSDCPALFAKFGLDLATGAQAATAQTVFRAIAK